MPYSILLILKKQTESDALPEIKKYIEEREGKILNISELGNAGLSPSKKAGEANMVKIEVEVNPKEIDKVKNKINHEKEVISYILEKKKIAKKIKEEVKTKKTGNIKTKPERKKQKTSKTKKVLDSMQEEEKKIKDLDSTLDKILNE